MEVIINDRRVKVDEDGEVWAFIKKGRSKTFKWVNIKGCNNGSGYQNMTINKKIYGKHRVIYKLYNPEWDLDDNSNTNHIDHIDHNPLNNKIENLRVLSQQLNMFNKNTKGCHYNTRLNKWVAKITAYKINHHLGVFEFEADARNAYVEAKKIYHKIEPQLIPTN